MQQSDILKECLEIGKISYDQELSRKKAITDKSEYLMKYHTLLIAILNLSLPLIIENANISILQEWQCIYVAAMAVILLGIISTLLIQRPWKIAMFPTGADELKRAKSHKGKTQEEDEWIYYKILLYSKATVSIEKVNKASIKWLIGAYVLFVCSVFLTGTFFYCVIIR
jgi:hypothetical protein